ncbi:hypothetical protein [Acidiphilium acidophilum]|uniref:Uncharacterized protein n=1 Tax=Acidiphilium acidophilum TaxID=76588 RepID=A0AAW9DQ17_ACIAO|nr:hypothetical protein [Acidiphilium acidophilum]MDX5931075.1 hypothetical protein [Acidiphilium acidophilum]
MTDHDPSPDPVPNFTLPAAASAGSTVEPEADRPEPIGTAAAEPARTRRLSLGLIGVIAFLLLAGGEAWLFRTIARNDDSTALAAQSARIAEVDQRVDRLESRMAALEDKVDHLKAAPAAQPAPAAVPQAPAAPSVPPELAKEITAMQASIAALSTTTLADHAAMADLQSKAADLPKLADQAKTMARLAQASLALQNGDPLGPLANAPDALMRYATARPPTIGALKASFPAYARKAERAGGEVTAHGGFWRNVKGHIESLVTIRHDHDVLVGSRAAGALGKAQTDLDDDDLGGAVAALKELPSPAKAAMAPWTRQADHLLAARAALATMAGQS